MRILKREGNLEPTFSIEREGGREGEGGDWISLFCFVLFTGCESFYAFPSQRNHLQKRGVCVSFYTLVLSCLGSISTTYYYIRPSLFTFYKIFDDK